LYQSGHVARELRGHRPETRLVAQQPVDLARVRTAPGLADVGQARDRCEVRLGRDRDQRAFASFERFVVRVDLVRRWPREAVQHGPERLAHMRDGRPARPQPAIDLQPVALLVTAQRRVEPRPPIAGRPVGCRQVEIAAVSKDGFEPDRVIPPRVEAPAGVAGKIEPVGSGGEGRGGLAHGTLRGCIRPESTASEVIANNLVTAIFSLYAISRTSLWAMAAAKSA
jgi:hypothetical protein